MAGQLIRERQSLWGLLFGLLLERDWESPEVEVSGVYIKYKHSPLLL